MPKIEHLFDILHAAADAAAVVRAALEVWREVRHMRDGRRHKNQTDQRG